MKERSKIHMKRLNYIVHMLNTSIFSETLRYAAKSISCSFSAGGNLFKII